MCMGLFFLYVYWNYHRHPLAKHIQAKMMMETDNPGQIYAEE